jgi:hypothetical protein
MRKKRQFVSVSAEFWERLSVVGRDYGFKPADAIREVLEKTFAENLPDETADQESAMFRS